MDNITEIVLHMPWNVVDDCNGFGLDFGGSVCKIIYLHNEDWTEPAKRTTDTVPLRCINISRSDFTEALEYLKPRVCIRRNDDVTHKPTVFISGVGAVQHTKEIKEAFNVETSTVTELECFNAAFNFILRNNKRGDIVHENNQDVIQRNLMIARDKSKMVSKFMKVNKNMDTMNQDADSLSSPMEQPFEAEEKYTEDIFPCFLVMIGSNGAMFYVREDGTYSFASDIKRAGRNFLGLACLLTKSKTFEEIMEKAEKGNMRPVHEYLGQVAEKTDKTEENFYSQYARQDRSLYAELPVFFFGKAVNQDLDDFKPEDLARSFLYSTVNDMVQTVHTATRLYPKVKHVFWCGGFPNHPLTRDLIIEHWLDRDGISATMNHNAQQCNLHFLKHGSHLGALGAYLNQHLHFISEAPESNKDQE